MITSAKNPKWANAEKTRIDLTVTVDGLVGEFPFTASGDDCEAHSCDVFFSAKSGAYGEVSDFVVTSRIRIDEIKMLLAELDSKKIRPIAEGDADYLAILNAQTAALREELRGLIV